MSATLRAASNIAGARAGAVGLALRALRAMLALFVAAQSMRKAVCAPPSRGELGLNEAP